MPKLHWMNWSRTTGCRKHMDKKIYEGTSYSAIFWTAMRVIFMDDKGKPGVLYDGSLAVEAAKAVEYNGRRFGFDAKDQQTMLFHGDFKYMWPLMPLKFEGPDLPEDEDVFATGNCPGFGVRINFYKIVEFAKQHFGTGMFGIEGGLLATALSRMIWFTGAVVLHEVMHNHGFSHPDDVNWTPGSDYASSLPHVALMAVLRRSPHRAFFDGIVDIQGIVLQAIIEMPETDPLMAERATKLQEFVNGHAVREPEPVTPAPLKPSRPKPKKAPPAPRRRTRARSRRHVA